MVEINTVRDFVRQLRNGSHAFPGCYPIYFICADGEALSFEAANDRLNKRLIASAICQTPRDDQWNVIAAEINFEDQDLYCAHTGKRIDPAYGD